MTVTTTVTALDPSAFTLDGLRTFGWAVPDDNLVHVLYDQVDADGQEWSVAVTLVGADGETICKTAAIWTDPEYIIQWKAGPATQLPVWVDRAHLGAVALVLNNNKAHLLEAAGQSQRG